METFCESYRLKNLFKVPTCYMNLQDPSQIDLILTNNSLTIAIETGLFNFHKMIVTVTKTTFQKLDPKITHDRDYRKYCDYSFREDLLSTLVMENVNLSYDLQEFIDICMKPLDIFAPRKKKCSRGSNMPFLNKLLSSAHMKRTRLRNCYLKKTLNRIDFLMLSNVITAFLF